MKFMLESAVHIVDEVLQQELSRASDEGMRNIVATIQRDRNAIIRNDQAPVLIIQGVAGSGKPPLRSTAFAFLLYLGTERLLRWLPIGGEGSLRTCFAQFPRQYAASGVGR